jgi:hypothetical protein
MCATCNGLVTPSPPAIPFRVLINVSEAVKHLRFRFRSLGFGAAPRRQRSRPASTVLLGARPV